jgi:membrane carboxypeptidase/penicillin-binding protein
MYDMVKGGKRQVGSTVKPFLYTLAMQNGLSPCSKVPCGVVPSFVHRRFVVVWLPRSIPDFGRFYGSHGAVGVDAVLAKNLPHRSRENEFTDGRVGRV